MKLLFDQNLSFRLVFALRDLFPDSVHVREVGLKSAADEIVWEYAKLHNYVIVSKDSDFHQKSFLLGFPPKIIWIALGNCSTKDVEQVLRSRLADIQAFEEDQDATFLSLS